MGVSQYQVRFYFREDFSVVFLYPIIRLSSASMDPILYQLLPYMSQSNPDVKPIVSGDFTNDTKDLGLDLSDIDDGQMDLYRDESSAMSCTADDSRWDMYMFKYLSISLK